MNRCSYVINNRLRDKEFCGDSLLPLQMFKHEDKSYCKGHILHVRVDVSGKEPVTRLVTLNERIKESKRL